MAHFPTNLKHKPIVDVDYENFDEEGDAKFLSLGTAQWDPENLTAVSAKVLRKLDNGGWSPRSEELPLWRVLDMAILIVAQYKQIPSYLNETVHPEATQEMLDGLHDYLFNEGKAAIESRIAELKRLLQ